MSEPLDESYFQWLYEQVADPKFKDQNLTYWKVLKILFNKEFVWIVANDENRIHDGKALRFDFLRERDIDPQDVDPDWLDLGCSVLELMVGLSRRLEFEADKGKAHYWFWVLMDNLGLSGYNDRRRMTQRVLARMDDILNDLIHRNYDTSGIGGFFPLRNPRKDQRKQELWYQMSAYILEKELAG